MKKIISTASTTLAVCIFLFLSLLAGNARADLIDETVTAKPTRPLTTIEEATISSAALKVLHHIAQARADIHSKDIPGAQKELKQAQVLLKIIKATVPTVKIKDRIWVAKKHLSYEDTATVMQDLVPIYASLDDIEEFTPITNAKEHINQAKKHMESGNKKGAVEELKLADDALVFTEIDLPLNNTEKDVNSALAMLAKKETKKADSALKSAEDGVQYLSLLDSSPVYRANTSFWKATKNYMQGKTDAAKADIKDSKAYLSAVGKTAGTKTKAEVEKLVKDIESVEGKMNKFDKETGQEIMKLYERIKAFTISTVSPKS